MVPIRILLSKENTCVLSLMIFYENRKSMVFKVLGSVGYGIMDNYVCADYLCLFKAKLFLEYYRFENTTFGDNSGIGTPELLVNIM